MLKGELYVKQKISRFTIPKCHSEEVWRKVEKLRNSRTYEVTLANGDVVRKGRKVAQDIWLRKFEYQCGGHYRKIQWKIRKSDETAF